MIKTVGIAHPTYAIRWQKAASDMEFQKHPDMSGGGLVELFKRRPYQGQAPEKATIIFLNSDANYSPELSGRPFFDFIREYQLDGVYFWKKYGVHHPFMLPNYPFDKRKGGVPFHRNFSKLGLEAEKHAEHISFLELLDVPTIGNKSQDREAFFDLLSPSHLKYIEKLILGGGRKLFFISKGVLKEIRKIKKVYPLFAWLDFNSGSGNQLSKSINGNTIKEIYHFSSSQIHTKIDEIKSEIDQWLKIKR